MTQPYKCPVCEGCGEHNPHGGTGCFPVCHACDGKGIVWEAPTETHTGPGPTGGPYYATSLSKPATPTSSIPGATP